MTTPILSIDTREAFRTLTVKLDGTVYTMRPLGSKDMLTILDNAETIDKLSTGVANRETLETAKKIIFPLVESLMSPADKFSEWKVKHSVSSAKPLAYNLICIGIQTV